MEKLKAWILAISIIEWLNHLTWCLQMNVRAISILSDLLSNITVVRRNGKINEKETANRMQ